MKDSDWDAVINTNLTAIFRLSKACLKGMSKARWGRIINISSVVGQMGNAGQTNYAAAKAGLEGFTRALAKEMGGRGITANCIAPGFIETDMTHALSETQQATMLANIPANRLGQPNDIAHTVVFLASDQAGYINGVTLPVNGGMYV
jgi:3-oxoacyl-[acyl-carrier protein] reductase